MSESKKERYLGTATLWTCATIIELSVFVPLSIVFNSRAHKHIWPFLDVLAYGGAALLGVTIASWVIYLGEKNGT